MADALAQKIKEFKDEEKNKPSPISVLKTACSSKTNFMFFVSNPAHWMFLALCCLALYGSFEVVWQLLDVSIGIPGAHANFPTQLGFFSVVALWIAAVSSLFQTTIQDQINWFRGCNDKLQNQVDQLKGDIDVLKDECDQLGESLTKFGEIRVQMEEEAAKQGISLEKFQSDWNGVFDNMAKMHKEQAVVYLEKIAADVSFRGDGEAGLTFDEFKDFCSRVPKEYRAALKDKEGTFTAAAGADNIIDTAECKTFIADLVEKCKGATKGK